MVLLALRRRVKENQARYNIRMIKNKGGAVIKYRKGQAVLKIPKKNNKQSVEAKRLPYRVVEIKSKVLKTTWI
jgi:hypothetical protein